MSRFFYSDPLAAAWMAKHFGMRFQSDSEADVAEIYHDRWENSYQVDVRDGAIHIHPDSLHLLEPKPGDLCYCQVAKAAVLTMFPEFDYLVYPRRGLWDLVQFQSVVQRNGLAFHWPEREEP